MPQFSFMNLHKNPKEFDNAEEVFPALLMVSRSTGETRTHIYCDCKTYFLNYMIQKDESLN